MNKPSILKSVSISEMLHMRETGLSNAEIADKIGCSKQTVIRHIGRAPFVKPGRGRKKKGSDSLGLPPVGDNPIPEMPHESFKERCERMANELRCNPTHWVPAECAPTTAEIMAVCEERHRKTGNRFAEESSTSARILPSDADAAREAHMKELEKTNTPYTTYKEETSHIPELIAMFGPDAVTAWLKVILYDMGIPDCRPMNRQKMLEMLKIMNAGGASV